MFFPKGPASLKPPLPVPPELLALKIPLRKTTPPLRLKPVSVLALLPGTPAASSASSASPAVSGQSVLGYPTTPAPPSAVSAARDPPAQSHRPAVPPMPSYEQDMSRWNCSHQQRIWMKMEMESLGLWPGSRPVRHPMNMISLWRNLPQPELIDSIYELPSPKYFQLQPFFIWK
ncbi:transcript variant X1 [Nothobranchius furzeri]|uniref:Transcript variant X1 n=1 Tax=Nothobranchius furzeri TaxID=105023 RepID=A0A9D2XCA0_NOTFU|nr:transcript variant X1 [Nothobranchius furzeri]